MDGMEGGAGKGMGLGIGDWGLEGVEEKAWFVRFGGSLYVWYGRVRIGGSVLERVDLGSCYVVRWLRD